VPSPAPTTIPFPVGKRSGPWQLRAGNFACPAESVNAEPEKKRNDGEHHVRFLVVIVEVADRRKSAEDSQTEEKKANNFVPEGMHWFPECRNHVPY
jgi:hypothetical protein